MASIRKYYTTDSSKLTSSFFSCCTSNSLFRVFIYLTSFELIFPLPTLHYCSNLPSISLAKIFAFQWKTSILHKFSFNWKVAAATATTSFHHTRLTGASATTKPLYQITDSLNTIFSQMQFGQIFLTLKICFN